MLRPSLLVVSLALVVEVLGCAETQSPQPTSAQSSTPRRRRRRAQAQAQTQPAPDAGSLTSIVADLTAAHPDASTAAPSPAARTMQGAPPTRNPPPPNAVFGSPEVGHGATGTRVTARWVNTEGERPRIVCDTTGAEQVPSMQSPWEPTNAMAVRAFMPVESQVLACRPPSDARGRFPVVGRFGGGGVPREFYLPTEVRIGAARARCLGEALCQTRMSAFRAGSAAVNFEFVVMVGVSE